VRNDIRNSIAKLGMAWVVGIAACAVVLGQDITTNSMPGTNFAQFHTYKWVTVQGAQYPNQIVDQEIKQAVDSQLAAKGLTKTDADNADLYVAYQVGLQQQQQWNAWGMRGFGGMGQATSSTIENGTLVLDMYQPSTKQLVWQGRASKTLNPSSNQQKNENNLNKAMAKLLKKFPPA
jgi:hypothetical protein